jgi:hypothetical protein
LLRICFPRKWVTIEIPFITRGTGFAGVAGVAATAEFWPILLGNKIRQWPGNGYIALKPKTTLEINSSPRSIYRVPKAQHKADTRHACEEELTTQD